MVKTLKDYFHEVRHCTCETFQQRYDHLKSAVVLSSIFFTCYFFFIRAPHFGATSKTFLYEVVGGTFPIIGFLLSIWLGKRYSFNQILTLPTMGCIASAYYNLSHPEYYLALPQLYIYASVIGIILGSFISSIRCNLILNTVSALMPLMAATLFDHLNLETIFQEMPIIFFAGLLGSMFSYRLNSYQKGLNKLKDNLKAEKNLLEQAQEVAKLGNWKLDVLSTQLKWSPQMFHIFPEDGSSGEPTLERHQNSIYRPDLQYWKETIQETIQSGQPFKIQFRTFRKDMETIVWVEMRGEAIKNPQGAVASLFGTCQDITEFKNLENALVLEKQKMIQSAKLASLGEMAAGVAHEINNPSAIIKGNNTMLKKKMQNIAPEMLEKILESNTKAIDRISRIVSGLRKFSRTSDGDDHKEIAISFLFQEIIELTISKSHKAFVKVETEPVPAGITLIGDEINLEQVIVNLVNNAIDENTGKKDAWVKLIYRSTEDFHEIIVQDCGEGISEEVLEHLFDPFYTTKEVGKGTGLGLSISKGIAQSHFGDLVYDLYQGHTAFILKIPKVLKKKIAA